MGKISKEKEQLIINLYENNASLYKISEYTNISRPTIRKILKRNKIIIYKKQYIPKIVNVNYFDNIDTEEKAYFLGLLFADGNIYLGTKNKKQYSVSISLIEKDKYILEKLRDVLSPNSKLYFIKKTKETNSNQYKFLIGNKIIANQLIKLGCVPRKSLILDFPEINNNLLNHFIRGYFDGDGCISSYLNKENLNYYRYSFSITSTKSFVLKVKEILKNNIDINSCINEKITKSNNKIYELVIGGNNQVNKTMNWLYQNSNLFLKRKYEIFKKLELQNKKYSPSY